MKYRLLILFFTIGIMSAQANENSLPLTLAATMKAMSNDLKTINTQVGNPQVNANSAALADHFVQLVVHAKDFVPDSIVSLPADQLAVAKVQYATMLDQTANTGGQLGSAFRANDNASAVNLLNQLLQEKKDGHNQFKP